MFTLVFDPANKALALAMGTALTNYANGVVETAGATIAPTPFTATQGPAPTADVEEYNEAETVKLSDSVAGLSESQSEIADETKVPETVQHVADDAPSVDKNGVTFDGQFCAKAAKPFYASGKYAGQWKKGTKVEQTAYDEWYAPAKAEAMAAHPVNNPTIASHTRMGSDTAFDTNNATTSAGFDTNAAFGAATEVGITEAIVNAAPQGIGPFIMWSAEQQTAGFLTQNDISEAYTTLGISQADISPANPNAQANITALHAILNAKAPF